MPKYMTYQRPTPVNKAAWTGKPGVKPHQPLPRAWTAPTSPEPAKPALPAVLPPSFRSS